MINLPETFDDLQTLLRAGTPLHAMPERHGSLSLRDLRGVPAGSALLDAAFLARLDAAELREVLPHLDHVTLRALSSAALDGRHLELGAALAAEGHGHAHQVNHAQVSLAPGVFDGVWFRDHAARIVDDAGGRHVTLFRQALRQMHLSGETLLGMTPLNAAQPHAADTLAHLLTLDALPGEFLHRHAQAIAASARTWTDEIEDYEPELRVAVFLLAHLSLHDDDARILGALPGVHEAISMLSHDDRDHRVATRADQCLYALQGGA